MKYIVIMLSLSLIDILSLPAAAGGWGSGGGGMGIACFESEQIASGAEENPEAHIKEIKSLVTLDNWDFKDQRPLIESKSDEKTLLDQALTRIADFSPIMGYRLQQVSPSMDISKWKPKGHLESTHDAHPRVAISSNCRLVQLVVRYSEEFGDRILNDDHVNHLPQVKIEYSLPLYSLLAPIDRALLNLHERLYFIGRMTGHFNSDDIREMTAFFFSKSFYSMDFEKPGTRRSLQGYVIDYLGDYMMYFGEEAVDGVDAKSAPPHSQLSRYFSFYSSLKRIRSDIGACLKRDGFEDKMKTVAEKNKIARNCQVEIMDPARLAKSGISEEEAFVLVARFALDTRGTLKTSEYLVVPSKNAAFLATSQGELDKACLEIQRIDTLTGAPIYPLVHRAVSYCVSPVLESR